LAATETLYGFHAVRTLLERSPRRLRRLRIASGRDDPRIAEILRLAQASGCAVQRADVKTLQRELGEAVHQGVVAEVEPLRPWTEDDLLAALHAATERGEAAGAGASGEDPLLLVLDGVQDPHNLGACLRTADACGALAVVVPRDRAAQVNATVRKVAAGAAETTPVVTVTNLARTLKLCKEAGLWIVGADMAGSRPAPEVDLKGPLAIVMGAEGGGLRQLTRQHCDFIARLPLLGAVESLNVSVASGMLLYEALRQRGKVV
jgi:23S rRNA (guanosine2251-2'-O)-methyltransferase